MKRNQDKISLWKRKLRHDAIFATTQKYYNDYQMARLVQAVEVECPQGYQNEQTDAAKYSRAMANNQSRFFRF